MTGDWDSYRNSLTRCNIAITKPQSWRKYCQGIDQIPSGARLMKVLKSDARNKNWLSKTSSWQLYYVRTRYSLSSTRDSFSWLKEVDSCPEEWGQSDLETYRVNKENWDLLQPTVNRTNLRLAINSFDPLKSAEPDLIIPTFLQQGINVLPSLLCCIYRACLPLGFIPTA